MAKTFELNFSEILGEPIYHENSDTRIEKITVNEPLLSQWKDIHNLIGFIQAKAIFTEGGDVGVERFVKEAIKKIKSGLTTEISFNEKKEQTIIFKKDSEFTFEKAQEIILRLFKQGLEKDKKAGTLDPKVYQYFTQIFGTNSDCLGFEDYIEVITALLEGFFLSFCEKSIKKIIEGKGASFL